MSYTFISKTDKIQDFSRIVKKHIDISLFTPLEKNQLKDSTLITNPEMYYTVPTNELQRKVVDELYRFLDTWADCPIPNDQRSHKLKPLLAKYVRLVVVVEERDDVGKFVLLCYDVLLITFIL
jgi:hypothetical protein